MQSFGFSLPLTLSTLLAYIVLFFGQGFRSKIDFMTVGNLFYLDKPQGNVVHRFNDRFHSVFRRLALGTKLLVISLIGFLLLWLSKMKITGHVWFPTTERLATVHK